MASVASIKAPPGFLQILGSETGAEVFYKHNFLNKVDAPRLFFDINKSTPWKFEEGMTPFKVPFVSTRKTCSFGDTGISYTYNKTVQVAKLWTPSVTEIRDKLAKETGQVFNYCLCNLYDDGKVKLGWHADDEKDILPRSWIASISLGCVREFQLRRYYELDQEIEAHSVFDHLPPGVTWSMREAVRRGEECLAVTVTMFLDVGSCLIMAGTTQEVWQHQVPARMGVKEPRINLTYRQIKSPQSPPTLGKRKANEANEANEANDV